MTERDVVAGRNTRDRPYPSGPGVQRTPSHKCTSPDHRRDSLLRPTGPDLRVRLRGDSVCLQDPPEEHLDDQTNFSTVNMFTSSPESNDLSSSLPRPRKSSLLRDTTGPPFPRRGGPHSHVDKTCVLRYSPSVPLVACQNPGRWSSLNPGRPSYFSAGFVRPKTSSIYTLLSLLLNPL